MSTDRDAIIASLRDDPPALANYINVENDVIDGSLEQAVDLILERLTRVEQDRDEGVEFTIRTPTGNHIGNYRTVEEAVAELHRYPRGVIACRDYLSYLHRSRTWNGPWRPVSNTASSM